MMHWICNSLFVAHCVCSTPVWGEVYDTIKPGELIHKLDHITLTVTDLAQSRRFYGSLLGLEETTSTTDTGLPGIWYRLGSVTLHLRLSDWTASDDGKHFALWAYDVYRTAQLLENADIAVQWDELPPKDTDRFFVRDPSGNLVEIRGHDHSP